MPCHIKSSYEQLGVKANDTNWVQQIVHKLWPLRYTNFNGLHYVLGIRDL